MQIVEEYKKLLNEIDIWFKKSISIYPDQIKCNKGCSECCRGLFDITLLDAFFIKTGFKTLPVKTRDDLINQANKIVKKTEKIWPDFAPPYLLNYKPAEEWDMIMPDDDETPCIFLDKHGNCLIYNYRPMTCRLHGLPMVDISGEVMHDEWCTNNFIDSSPLEAEKIRAPFREIIKKEVELGRLFSKERVGKVFYELDTLIPTAILIDFDNLILKDIPLVEEMP